MRRRILTVLFLASLICTAGVALWLVSLREEVPANLGSDMQYILLAPDMEERYWVEVASGAKAADRDLGTDTLLVHYRDQNNLPEYIRDAGLSGVKGIIMKGDLRCGDAVAEVVGNGIPILFYDSDFPQKGRTSYVGNDNYALGYLAGELLEELMGPEGAYLIVTRSKNAFSQSERLRGIEDALSGCPDLACAQVIEDRGEMMTLRLRLQEALRSDGPIRGILTLGGISADILGNLLEQFSVDPEEMSVIVTDLTETAASYIQSGTYDAVIALDPRKIGYRSVEALWQYDTKGIPLSSLVTLDTSVVTQDNLSEYLKEKENDALEWNSY